MLNRIVMRMSKHVPSTAGFHDASLGLHRVKGRMALMKRVKFKVMMMSHTAFFSHPSVSLNKVRANEVLENAAAISVNALVTLTNLTRVYRFSTGTMAVCLPKPNVTA